MDREKVIKGLEHCGFTEKRGCVGCPYSDECGDFGRDAGMSSLATDALALLREQETTWVREEDRTNHYHCEKCGYVTGIIARMHKYCPECGRKVKCE